MLDNVKAGEYVSYGKKLGFVHAPDAFSAHGRDVLAFLDRALASRRTMDAHAQWGFGLRRIERDLHISPPEIDELVRRRPKPHWACASIVRRDASARSRNASTSRPCARRVLGARTVTAAVP